MISTLSELMARGEAPRWHGNGFVQLPLNARQRLHVWSNETTPLPENNATTHNHVWGMRSFVLMGALTHETYNVTMDGEGRYDRHMVNSENEFVRVARVSAYSTGRYRLAEGSGYFFPSGSYHTSVAASAMTLIDKEPMPFAPPGPDVLSPHGEEPYNAHGVSKLSVDEMWSIIQRAIAVTKSTHLNILEAALS